MENRTRDSVWVANRENPLDPDISATLIIQDDGNLAVADEAGKIFWSTNVRKPSKTRTIAVLQDTGNLVLKGKRKNSSHFGSDIALWQSFDHPTHLLLPGMKVGIDLRTKQTKMLKSWKNGNDPAPGNFEFGIDEEGGSKQFFIYRRSIPYRRAVFWNGSGYDDTSRSVLGMGSPYINYSITERETEVYFTFHSPSVTDRLQMSASGYVVYTRDRGHGLSAESYNWIGETDGCPIFDSGKCGKYSICNMNSRPMCKCLPGFERAGYECMRKTVLKCGREDGVLGLKGVELSGYNSTVTEDEAKCRESCLSSRCECKGYAFMSNSSECRLWLDDLKEIREEELAREELVANISIPVAASDLSKLFALLPIFLFVFCFIYLLACKL